MAEKFSGGDIPQILQESKAPIENALQGTPAPGILPQIERSIQNGENSMEIAEQTRGEGEIGYDELPSFLKDSLSEEQFNGLISQSVMHGVGEAEGLMEHQAGLYPQPESDQFKHEIENPDFRLDPETNINYAVRWLNQDNTGKPLVVKLLWSAGANSRTSRGFLNTLAAKTNQPIVVIDSVATGDTSIPERKWMKKATFDSMADSEKRILDQELKDHGLDESKIDILGMSMGGIQAAKLAERYGDRVDKLLTFSTPGFAKRNPVGFAWGFAIKENAANEGNIEVEELGIKDEKEQYEAMFGPMGIELDKDKLPGLYKIMPGLLKGIKPFLEDFSKMLPPEQFSSEQVPAFFRFYHLMTRAPINDLPGKLDPHTQWFDIVGSDDAIIKSSDHLEAVRERNKTLRRTSSGKLRGDPNYYKSSHKSSVHILGSSSHSWFGITTEVADKAVQLLKETEKEVKTA